MVLQANFAKRADSENTPPSTITQSKGLANRLRNTLHDASRRRRARTSGGSLRTPKYTVTQSKHKVNNNKTKSSLRFTITASTPSTPPAITDVEMQDASPKTSRTIPVVLPRELARPDYREVSSDALQAVDPELADTDPEYVREKLEEFGPSMLSVLGNVRAALTTNTLPAELNIMVQDLVSAPPTHMVAVFGPIPPNGPPRPRKVTLYPVHSIVFAAHCANLPPFPPSATTQSSMFSSQEMGTQHMTVPVRSLCLPSPDNYPNLAAYLYHKRTDVLLNSVLPCAAPSSLEENQTQIATFATKLGRTYTFEALLVHTMMVHGLWQNVCALGIFDDLLWDTIDLAWQVLLTAMAVSTGKPSLMILPESMSA